jgi:hypothetical protein
MSEKESNPEKNIPNSSMPPQPLNMQYKNQYIFILHPITIDLNILKNGIQDSPEKYILLPCHSKELKRCKCNLMLRLFQFDAPLDLRQFYYDKAPSEYFIQSDGEYYNIIGAMPNIIHGSPDDDDPKPISPPVKGSANGYFFELDEYVPLRKAWLDAARSNNFNNPDAPVVAIMDTGIDMRYFPNEKGLIEFPLHYYRNHPCNISPNLCYVKGLHCCEGLYGWDFIKNDPHKTFPENPFDDDLRHKHGTRIAKIIANVTKSKVRIMPLKTANYRGESEFFDIFCAFEFILNYNSRSREEDKVKFINASWGYYGQEYEMFTHYMEAVDKLDLKRKDDDDSGIKFINAAGNAGDRLEDGRPRGHDDKVKLGENVGEHLRYPTMYSEVFDRVYTVTTLDKNRKAVENYSNVYVEVGIVGETQGNVKGTFPDPLNPSQNAFIKGSSYATAYLTGMIVGGSVIIPPAANQGVTILEYDRQNQIANNFVNSIIIEIGGNDAENPQFTTLVAS